MFLKSMKERKKMDKCKCKLCGEVIEAETSMRMDWLQWSHLRENHPKEFKEQMDKKIDDLLNDNFEKRRDLQ